MSITQTVAAIANAGSWDARVALMRQIPEKHGIAEHAEIYASVAAAVYVDAFGPDFAYIPWRDEYELAPFLAAYQEAEERTNGFTKVDVHTIEATLIAKPETLRVFRTIVGFLPKELAEATIVVETTDHPKVSDSAVKRFEDGQLPRNGEAVAGTLARLIEALMAGTVLNNPEPPARRKQDKPDTAKGWSTVRDFAANGVPYGVFLHQRHYGGAFRQLLDATGTARGDLLEDAVENLARDHKIPYIRTGAHNQADIAKQFNLTVRPAPDFVFYDNSNTLRALLECKQANDGGTARDKARRFAALREEATRLGGIPLIAMLSGLGWRRTRDALGPVVRDCDGRVFSLETLPELLTVAPFPQLAGTASQP